MYSPPRSGGQPLEGLIKDHLKKRLFIAIPASRAAEYVVPIGLPVVRRLRLVKEARRIRVLSKGGVESSSKDAWIPSLSS